MLCILPACSGWLLLSPHVHWCFSIWESYTRPAFAFTHIHTNTKKRDLTDFCFKYLQLHTFVAIEEGCSSFCKISNYFLLPVLSKAIRNNTFICYFNLVFTLDGYICPQKDRETERSTSQAVNTNTNIISKYSVTQLVKTCFGVRCTEFSESLIPYDPRTVEFWLIHKPRPCNQLPVKFLNCCLNYTVKWPFFYFSLISPPFF